MDLQTKEEIGTGLTTGEVDGTDVVTVKTDIESIRARAKRQGVEGAKNVRKRKSWLRSRKRICV